MKTALLIVPLSVMLSACAGGVRLAMPQASPQTAQPAVSAQAAEGPPPVRNTALRRARLKPQPPAADQALPAAALSKEILFQYMSAELADQRGDWKTAYVNMLIIAQKTRDPRVARRAAEIAVNAKQSGEALAAIRLWREVAPESDEAAQYFLGFVVLSDNLAEARPLLQQRLKEARPQVLGGTILQMQRALASARNKSAAFSLLDELLVPYKDILEAHLALAQAAYALGNSTRATAEARAAVAINPTSELAVLTLGQVLPDRRESTALLAAFLAKNPKAREVRLGHARLLVEQKRYEEARREFKILLVEQPNDLTALYALGLLGTQSNDMKEAETYLTAYLKALAGQPDDERDTTQALLILSQIAEQRNDTQAALKWLDQIDAGTPQAYLGAQIKRAQLIAKSGNVPAARKLLQELSTNGEDDQVQLLVAEAQILRSLDQAETAMTVLESGLQRFPNNVDLLYDYAMLAEKLNKLDIMETSLRKMIAIAPNNHNAYNALGYSLAERNIRLPEAFTLIEKALQLAPDDPFIIDSMGWVQFRLGRLAEAEALLRRAYALRPDAEIAVHLGEVLWVRGQQDDAKKLWRDAIVKDPKSDILKSTLARLQVQL
ncbi:MAG: tetratricopeptide repeat protein [Pseudomonadota bacterium]